MDYSKLKKDYKEGFSTDIESFVIEKGLSEETVRKISELKEEPEWLLEFRLKAFRRWQTMEEPTWSTIDYEPIDYQNISYYSEPKSRTKDEIPQEIFDTMEKLGVPMHERDAFLGIEDDNKIPAVAIDVVFDSVSVATTFKK